MYIFTYITLILMSFTSLRFSLFRSAITPLYLHAMLSRKTLSSGKVKYQLQVDMFIVQKSSEAGVSHCSDPGVCVTHSDVRWKNKFWGKSMEIVPVGTTHVMLPG